MIRKDIIYLAIIIILLGIVTVMTCSGPEPVDPEQSVYIERNKKLEMKLAIIEPQFERAVVIANRLSKEKDSLKGAFLKEIDRLTRNAKKARTPKVDTLILDNPELKIFVETQDSVIQTQSVLIDTLQSQIQFERGVREQLTALHYDANKITSNLLELKDYRIVTLEKDLKKEKRKGRFLKVVAIVGSIAAFIGGSQL